MTFRSKIIAILVLVAVIPVAISGLLSTKVSQDELISRVNQSHENNVYLIADEVNRFLKDAKKALRLSTELIPFDEFPKEHLSDAVRIPLRQFDYLNALVLLKPDGSQLTEIVFESATADHVAGAGRQVFSKKDLINFERNIPLENAVKNGQGWSNVYFGDEKNGSRLAMALSFPVETEDGHWILAAEISLVYLKSKLQKIAPKQGGNAFVVDRNGQIVSHSGGHAQLATVLEENHPIVKRGFGIKNTGVRHFVYENRAGKEMVGAFASVPVVDFGVVVEQETEHAFRSAYQIKRYTVFWIVVGIIIAVFGGLILSYGISKPVMEMAKGVRAIEKGNFTTRLTVKSKDEIGQLARSFNHMSEELSLLIENYERLFISSVHTLVASVEAKDVYTRGHSERVTGYTLSLCDELRLSLRDREIAELASLLHDVGKIGIPEDLLNKRGFIGPDEFDTIKSHPVLGERIVSKIEHEHIDAVSALVRSHHEKWDGTGYPDGLRGEQIPYLARVLAIADAYDAMTSDRAYRKGMPEFEVLLRISENAGTQFDPTLVEPFCTLAREHRLVTSEGKSKYIQSVNPKLYSDKS